MQEHSLRERGDSKRIASKQIGIHPSLGKVVERHMRLSSRADLPDYISALRSSLLDFIQRFDQRWLIDSGCGTGDSTLQLASKYPQHAVIGVDKSVVRLRKAKTKLDDAKLNNVLFLRADLVYFWRMIKQLDKKPQLHYLFHPNPWPKAQHLQRRWHGHAVFSDILDIGGHLELHTNWLIYAQEFAFALRVAKGLDVRVERLGTLISGSAFEKKYRSSGHVIYRVAVQLGEQA